MELPEITHRSELWKLIKASKLIGSTAEIGVAEGYFSNDILLWPVKDQVPVHYLVDRWGLIVDQKGDGGYDQSWHDANRAAAIARVASHGNRAVFLQGDSAEMSTYVPDRTLSLLYIDGDHSYEGVMRDLLAWTPKVLVGGFVALHDYLASEYGVREAVSNFCQLKGIDVHVIPENSDVDAGAWFQI